MRIIIFIFLIFATAFKCNGQCNKLYDIFEVSMKSDTIGHGGEFLSYFKVKEKFIKDTAHIKFSALGIEVPIVNGTAIIHFVSSHHDFKYNDTILVKYLSIKVNYYNENIDCEYRYFTKPNVAYIRSLNNPPDLKYELYPEKKPYLNSKSLKQQIADSLNSLNLSGHLVISYVININGELSDLKIHTNTFENITHTNLSELFHKLSFVPGSKNGIPVNTLDFLIYQVR